MERVPAGLVRGVSRAAGAATDHATTFGYLSGWRMVRLLPERAAHAVFRRIADEIFRRDGKGVQRLRANLHRVRPDIVGDGLDSLTHEAVRSYLRYWCELFRLPSWPTEDVVRRLRTVDEHLVRDAYAQGRGVVVPLPHMANWDWAGAWACATGMPLATVAERLRPERLYDEFVAYRATLGMQAKGGIAERADRLVAVLAMTGLSDLLDLPVLIPVTLAALAVASTVTVFQRVMLVRSQARATV